MKFISLWQPWASFVARGYKRWETRSWQTEYRGPLAIHAARTTTDIWSYRFKLLDAGVIASHDEPDDFPKEDKDWPLGCIVAVCRLADCIPTDKVTPTRMERALGDYSPKRYAWILEDIKAVRPLPCTGRQGIRDLPPEIETKIEILEAA